MWLPRFTVRHLLSSVLIVALTSGLLASVPGLAKFQAYRALEHNCRHQASIARSNNNSGLAAAFQEQADNHARVKSDGLVRGSTALSLFLLAIVMGCLWLMTWACYKLRGNGEPALARTLFSVCSFYFTILLSALALCLAWYFCIAALVLIFGD